MPTPAAPAHAFPEVYRDFSPALRARCVRLLGSGPAIDDVVQETFARLWASGRFLLAGEPRALAAWLHRTAERLAIDALRDRARVRPCDPDVLEPSSTTAAPDDIADARVTIAGVVDVPPRELEAATLARVDGLTHPAVATAMGVSERTVRRLLDRFDRRTAGLRASRAAVRGRWSGVALVLVLTLAALLSSRSCSADPADAPATSAPVSPQ